MYLLGMGAGVSISLAQPSGIAVEVLAGEPSSVNVYAGPDGAGFVAGIGRTQRGGVGTDYHFSLQVNSREWTRFQKVHAFWYYSLGTHAAFVRDEHRVGIIAPAGLRIGINGRRSQRHEVFVEAGPVVDFTPGRSLVLAAGIGYRYYIEGP